MVQKSGIKGRGTTSDGTCQMKTLKSENDAKRIVDFLLSEDSFDDRGFTEGEIKQIENLPSKCLKDLDLQVWYIENEVYEIIGVICLRENEHKSGGFIIDFIAVHKQYRNRGIARKLNDVVTKQVKLLNGRYIQANTCDTPIYEAPRKMFEKYGFSPVGHLPDYYFEGEGMIIYYKKV